MIYSHHSICLNITLVIEVGKHLDLLPQSKIQMVTPCTSVTSTQTYLWSSTSHHKASSRALNMSTQTVQQRLKQLQEERKQKSSRRPLCWWHLERKQNPRRWKKPPKGNNNPLISNVFFENSMFELNLVSEPNFLESLSRPTSSCASALRDTVMRRYIMAATPQCTLPIIAPIGPTLNLIGCQQDHPIWAVDPHCERPAAAS